MHRRYSRWLGCWLIVGPLVAGCKPQPAAGPPASTDAVARQTTPAVSPRSKEDPQSAPQLEGPPVSDPPALLTEDELAEGWLALFDGQTLFGWTATSDANWRVEDGTVVVDLFGKALGKMRISSPQITIKVKVFLIGALVPLLIDTMLVQYFWNKTNSKKTYYNRIITLLSSSIWS